MKKSNQEFVEKYSEFEEIMTSAIADNETKELYIPIFHEDLYLAYSISMSGKIFDKINSTYMNTNHNDIVDLINHKEEIVCWNVSELVARTFYRYTGEFIPSADGKLFECPDIEYDSYRSTLTISSQKYLKVPISKKLTSYYISPSGAVFDLSRKTFLPVCLTNKRELAIHLNNENRPLRTIFELALFEYAKSFYPNATLNRSLSFAENKYMVSLDMTAIDIKYNDKHNRSHSLFFTLYQTIMQDVKPTMYMNYKEFMQMKLPYDKDNFAYDKKAYIDIFKRYGRFNTIQIPGIDFRYTLNMNGLIYSNINNSLHPPKKLIYSYTEYGKCATDLVYKFYKNPNLYKATDLILWNMYRLKDQKYISDVGMLARLLFISKLIIVVPNPKIVDRWTIDLNGTLFVQHPNMKEIYISRDGAIYHFTEHEFVPITYDKGKPYAQIILRKSPDKVLVINKDVKKLISNAWFRTLKNINNMTVKNISKIIASSTNTAHAELVLQYLK